jgi:hypothetical protein
VGWSDVPAAKKTGPRDFRTHATLWRRGTPIDFNTVVDALPAEDIVLEIALNIDNEGRILAQYNANRQRYYVLLTPVKP